MVCIFLLLTNVWEFPSHFAPGLETQWNEFLDDFIFYNSRLQILKKIYTDALSVLLEVTPRAF